MRKIRKTEIIAYLNDKSYHYHYDYWPISWDIKVRETWPANGRVDKNDKPLDLGMAIAEDGKREMRFNNPEFDELWELYTENDHDLCWNMCENWLAFAGENAWWDLLDGTEDPAIQAANDAGVKFYTAGRSNGHLVLDKFDGHPMGGRGVFHEEVLSEWDYNDLWTLYKACHIVDRIVDNRHESLAYLYADFRFQKEDEWVVIPELPTCEECDHPINYNIVEPLHIESHFCRCDRPVIPRANHFYCSTESCTGQAVNVISLEHGYRKYTCKECSVAMVEVNRRGPISRIVPLEAE